MKRGLSQEDKNARDLAIGEVARFAGIQASAIRYYERKGLLPRPRRVNGRRRYDLEVLKRLGLIQLARQAGFGIREIQVLFGGQHSGTPSSLKWQAMAAAKIAELDAVIRRTQATKAWLVDALKSKCGGVDECVSLSFDGTGSNMSVNLSCRNLRLNRAPNARPPARTLMTLRPPRQG